MNLFNTVEIVDMGIEKEKKRRDFYALVSERFQDRDMRELFTRLKDWEESHIKKFTEIRNRVHEDKPTDSYPGELLDYMKTLVDDKLYNDVSAESFSKNVKYPISAIEYGIGFEKDAILFFNELLPYVSSSNKNAIAQLIGEEKQHVIYLTELKRKLK